jgi:LPXTG-motif cell wall-anchored protein
MAELTPAGGGPNRLFVILAVGLGALLILGLIGVGGIFLLQRAGGPAPTPPPPPANTLVITITTPTRAALAPTLGAGNLTPTEQPTPTFVVISGGATETPGASPTFVLGAGVGATETPASGELPKSGAGDNMFLLAGGIVLVLVVFAARRARFYSGT